MAEKSPQRTVKSLIFHNSALHSGALIIHSEEWALASFLAKLSSSATGRNRNEVGHVTHPCASKRSVGQRTMPSSVVHKSAQKYKNDSRKCEHDFTSGRPSRESWESACCEAHGIRIGFISTSSGAYEARNRKMINDSVQIMTLAGHFITSCDHFAPSPEGGGAAGEGEVGTEISAHTVNMLTHQHAMDAEPRSALGCLVDPIWINSYHDTAKTWQLEYYAASTTRSTIGAESQSWYSAVKQHNSRPMPFDVHGYPGAGLPFPRLNVELFHSLGNAGIKRLLYARAAFQYLCTGLCRAITTHGPRQTGFLMLTSLQSRASVKVGICNEGRNHQAKICAASAEAI
ncbi:hypothetical protein EDB92DRAFT_1814599 [Lactarius akahatsu]|uniref:Uncharacterized protein n=1 Tax=Lactarius akahatsu TaxID=416441 RepID=A0AAD4QFU1_9AGAM|nr:hypothetical protein EDB92DRAFT_1814599 [Lactarius akahatsu]